MKVWTATNALTHGVIELRVTESKNHPELLFFVKGFKHPVSKEIYFARRSECHLDRAAAVREAEEMRAREIADYESELNRIRSLVF